MDPEGFLGVVTGISLFQSLITPVVDSLKNSAVEKAVSVLPGIGNAADGVLELALGSAVVIRNSVEYCYCYCWWQGVRFLITDFVHGRIYQMCHGIYGNRQ